MLDTIITAVCTIIAAAVGSVGFWEYRKARCERASQAVVTREELKDISQTLKRLERRIDENSTRLDEAAEWHNQHEAETRAHRLHTLRQTLMQTPHDRLTHEHQLEAGREYLEAGGNGPGHVRYGQLMRAYSWRSAHDDWDYTHKPPAETMEGKDPTS